MSGTSIWTAERAEEVIRRGPWLATATGGCWSIRNPRPEDASIIDIAIGLSTTCRYHGQIKEDVDFLAVSEHSVLMLKHAEQNGMVKCREDALAILIHDGSEGYLIDMATPIKAMIPDFRKIEDSAQEAINTSFGVIHPFVGILKSEIKSLDRRICIDERNFGIADPARMIGLHDIWNDHKGIEPLGCEIRGLSPREARREFLETFLGVCNIPARNPQSDAILERHIEDAKSCLDRIDRSARKNVKNEYQSETLEMEA